MTANELRIGNLILFSPSGKKNLVIERPVKVINLLDEVCIVEDKGLRLELFYDSASTKPIPLTEEWLLKFGFEKDNFITREWNHDHSHIKMITHYENGFLMLFRGNSIGTMIKHVHQLQNLYHALTGEELQLKNTKNQ